MRQCDIYGIRTIYTNYMQKIEHAEILSEEDNKWAKLEGSRATIYLRGQKPKSIGGEWPCL